MMILLENIREEMIKPQSQSKRPILMSLSLKIIIYILLHHQTFTNKTK